MTVPAAPRPVPRPAPRWQRWFPGLRTLRTYERAWLRNDLAAGLVLATMRVPVKDKLDRFGMFHRLGAERSPAAGRCGR